MSQSSPPARPNPLHHSQVIYRGGTYSQELKPSLTYPDASESEFWTVVPSRPLTQVVLRQAQHVCHYCGFKSRKYQVVLARNGRTWDIGAMVAACIFCAQVKTLDLTVNMRSAVMIHAPEIPQTDLITIAKAIYVARISQGPRAEEARALLEALMQRRTLVENGLGSADPAQTVALLEARKPETVESVGRQLMPYRVMPLDRRIIREADLEFNQFPQILAYWRSKDGPYGGMTPPQWSEETFAPFKDGTLGPISTRSVPPA